MKINTIGSRCRSGNLKRLYYHAVVILLMVVSFSTTGCMQENHPASPVKVIIDTDLDSDVDDVGAMAMLYNLHNASIIELVGIIVTSDDPYAPVCAAAMNTFYGVPDIPIGFLKNQPELKNHSRYTRQIAGEFPSAMGSWEEAEDAVGLYRRLLASSNDESVLVVTIGHLSSLQGLLQSEPDNHSTMNGIDLAHQKISRWICMGGQYPQGKEANFYRPDPQSTVYCINNWKKEAVFYGWELGNLVITGGEELKEMLPAEHPVYRGYELYNNFAGRQSWDQLAVLDILDSAEEMFTFVKGECIVAPDGSNTWRDDDTGLHSYARLKDENGAEYVRRYIDNLMAGNHHLLNDRN